jgi:hypothetical protein
VAHGSPEIWYASDCFFEDDLSDHLTNKKVVFASSHSQRFEHLDILLETFTSLLYVLRLNLSAESKKSKTTTLISHSSLSLYSYLVELSINLLVCQGGIHALP